MLGEGRGVSLCLAAKPPASVLFPDPGPQGTALSAPGFVLFQLQGRQEGREEEGIFHVPPPSKQVGAVNYLFPPPFGISHKAIVVFPLLSLLLC